MSSTSRFGIESKKSVTEMNEDEECPVKQVELTVSKTDDPTLPVVTFRMWVLGILSCVVLSFVNQFFWYRTQPLSVTSISAQIAVVPLGHFMARVLPTRVFFKDTWFEFSMNRGPFNIKEHVLITIFANSGAGSVYATHILSAVKLMYKRKLSFLPALLLMLTTQVLFCISIYNSIPFFQFICSPKIKLLFKHFSESTKTRCMSVIRVLDTENCLMLLYSILGAGIWLGRTV